VSILLALSVNFVGVAWKSPAHIVITSQTLRTSFLSCDFIYFDFATKKVSGQRLMMLTANGLSGERIGPVLNNFDRSSPLDDCHEH